MANKKKTDDEIRALLDEEIRNSVGFHAGELSTQRRTALEYYYGEPFGNEVEGRSSYVSRDVADTIEWIMPALMDIFTAGDEVVRFEPQEPSDEKAADQATDYVNYIFNRQNDGFLTLYTWFKDALISKNGFVKVYYEEYSEVKTSNYENLSDDEFTQIAMDDETEILEHTEEIEESVVMTPQGPMPQQQKVHSVKVRTKKNKGKCCVVPIPPEEILVNQYPTAPLKNNRFIAHRRKVTISELKLMGYENVDDIAGYEDEDYNEERVARFDFDETAVQDSPSNPENRKVWLAECYVKLDVDGDGIAELRKITVAGDRLLDNEEVESIPFCTLTPIILPHKLYGMSIADLVMDLQLLKSTVFRQILDNMYLANNGRYMALDGMVNIDDLLTSRPGGIVRVKTFDAVKPMQPPLLGAPAFNLLEYIDGIKENRTGVTRYNQGVDADSLNKTATGINQIMSAAQQRIKLIARIFSETGVKDLFYAILECVQKYQDKEDVIKLRNEWVQMDPREWTNKFNMTVMVGLGTGNKDTLMMHLDQTIQLQLAALQGGLPIVTPENIYATAMQKLKAAGIKGGDMFFTHPTKIPPKPPQPDPKVLLGMEQLKLDAQKQQVTGQQKQQKMEQDYQVKVAQLQEQAKQAQIEAQLQVREATMKAQIEMAKAEAMKEIEREKAAFALMQARMDLQHDTSENAKDRYHEAKQAQDDRFERIATSFTEALSKIAESANRPKKVTRDEKGRVAGVE